MKRTIACLVALATLAVALSASADPKHNVITLKTTEIVGTRVRPLAAVEVSKARVSVTPPELRQSLVDRIDQSVNNSSL